MVHGADLKLGAKPGKLGLGVRKTGAGATFDFDAAERRVKEEQAQAAEAARTARQAQEAADAAAEALLQRLTDADARMETPVLSAHEMRVLEHLFDEHRHEFLQQKRLYSELADELKRMEPSMDKTKRRILAEHVHESIDALEAEATRINELHAHLVRCQRRTR